jgi:hypothetical protein
MSWEEIFAKWRESEAWQESWKKHWESRGWSSWDEWRKAYSAPLFPGNLQWFLFEVKEPLKDSSLFYGVPSRSWIEKVYGEASPKQLRDILDHPIIRDNDKISAIKKNFPEETMLTGLVHEDKIILIEGMHRACALASWDPAKPLEAKITIALAKWKEKDIPIIGGNYKKSDH